MRLTHLGKYILNKCEYQITSFTVLEFSGINISSFNCFIFSSLVPKTEDSESETDDQFEKTKYIPGKLLVKKIFY